MAKEATGSRKSNPNRGSKPGERRGGRKPGTPNKSTAEIKALAAQYTEAALAELARLCTEAESEAARVSAIKELFDRAFGKAAQSVDLTGDMKFTGLDVTIRR